VVDKLFWRDHLSTCLTLPDNHSLCQQQPANPEEKISRAKKYDKSVAVKGKNAGLSVLESLF
jgi:hypothetical protein